LSADQTVTAKAHPNLALVKYWGKRNAAFNLPTNGSISINLGGLTTTTTVSFDAALEHDQVEIDGADATGAPYDHVSAHLDRIRSLARIDTRASVISSSNFPVAAGLASSASAFAALTMAATRAAGLDLGPLALSALARRGSGSACRSIPGGFAEWLEGDDDLSSYAVELAPATHWDLCVISAVLDDRPKEISSAGGHAAAPSSPLFDARLQTLAGTLEQVRRAVLERDIRSLVMAAEREAISMHAIAMTSRPDTRWHSGVYYWQAATMEAIQRVQDWRRDGLAVGFTIDAGANIHLLCEGVDLEEIKGLLAEVLPADARLLVSRPGRGAWVAKEIARPLHHTRLRNN